jgi:predicted SprT family Zn-dependent metalloprotease
MNPKLAEQKAIELMHMHGVISMGYRFQFANRKRSIGRCTYSKRLIELSLPIIRHAEEDDVINVILHEIAHALCPGDGHGKLWRKTFISLGGDGKRFASMETSLGNALSIVAKYVAVCPNGHKHFKNRKPKYIYSCAICDSTKFNPNYLLNYKENK